MASSHACPHCNRTFVLQTARDLDVQNWHTPPPAEPVGPIGFNAEIAAADTAALAQRTPVPIPPPQVAYQARQTLRGGLGGLLAQPVVVQGVPVRGLPPQVTHQAPQAMRGGWRGVPAQPIVAPRPRFTIWFESRGYGATKVEHFDSDTPFSVFLTRLQAISTQVTQYYVHGRTKGFTLAAGDWHFRGPPQLADILPLTSSLWYQTMKARILGPISNWSHAVVFHVRLSRVPRLGKNIDRRTVRISRWGGRHKMPMKVI